MPAEADTPGRKAWLKERWMKRQSAEADRFRDLLVKLYGEERGRNVRYAEAFEVCEYGHRPTPEDLRRLFPFFKEVP